MLKEWILNTIKNSYWTIHLEEQVTLKESTYLMQGQNGLKGQNLDDDDDDDKTVGYPA